MKTLTIWQRLNLAQLFLLCLLFVGVVLAWTLEKARSSAIQRQDQLLTATGRIRLNLAELSDGLRGQLLDPASEAEKQRATEAGDRLSKAISGLESMARGHAESLRALRALNDFTSKQLILYKNKVSDMTRSDPAAATTYYAQTYARLQLDQDKLLDDLSEAVENQANAQLEDSQTTVRLLLVCLVLIFVASVVTCAVLSASVNKPLTQLGEFLNRMRRGDFTQRLPTARRDEFGVIGEGVNRLADDLSVLVGQVQRSGIQVNTTATQIAATAKQQQSTANEIAATTAEIGATSKQISSTSKELVKTMTEVTEVAEDTAGLAGSGQSAIARMESTMHQIMNAASAITAKLAVLNEKTGNINSVVTTINKVADQTNLLSLNAAIEAEKAGEYGLGFAVVAMEIRRLADQTAVATYDIEKMVKEMQTAVSAGVMGMDKFSEEVRRGVDEIRQVGAQLAQIIHQVQALTPRFQVVNEGMHSQATGAQQICDTLIQLSEAAHQTADSLQQSTQVIEHLNEAARGLQISVARFKLLN